ncbi:MAG: RNA-guided pseudouridylation complex pseudouridine synthase subunit Cbf5 [Euryarchaeota archaeon]|nr:RNA-guided pseudouridylation complex pseudouridine synthase subunit Cbf5 [Euryarchaeota archaeon]
MSVEALLNFGVVIIDKPKGPTSHQVSAWVRKILNVNRTGHAGTLDPKVTGVLPVALNRATKLINYLHYLPKEYVSVMRLHGEVDDASLHRVFEEFQGEIYQIPPVRSAVARRLRKRTVHSLKFIEREDKLVLFRAKVQSGTYIRSLCRDMGDALCVGAQMEDLRRVATAQFTEEDAVSLTDLLDAYVFWKEDGDDSLLKQYIKPGDSIVSFLPRIVVWDSALKNLANGSPLYRPGVAEMPELQKGELCTVYTRSGQFISVSRFVGDDEVVAVPERVIVE